MTTIINILIMLLYPGIMLLLLWIIALLFWHRRWAKWLFILSIVLFYFMANGMLAKWLIVPLENGVHEPAGEVVQSHRAMIVLGDGISHYPGGNYPEILSYSRLLEAYKLYRIAKAHGDEYKIFLTGGHTNSRSPYSEAELYKKILVQMGVPDAAIVTENTSLNTFQNAQFLRPILHTYPFKQYLLVTSAVHMKRAQRYFAHFGIKTVPAPSDFPYPLIHVFPTGYNLALYEMALHEYAGFIRFDWYQYFGLNKRRS